MGSKYSLNSETGMVQRELDEMSGLFPSADSGLLQAGNLSSGPLDNRSPGDSEWELKQPVNDWGTLHVSSDQAHLVGFVTPSGK